MSEAYYIDVTGSAVVVRPIEMLCATIKINVITRKAKVGLERSLALRDRVIQVLKSVGIAESDMTDAGGSVNHSTWSSKKQITHKICIQSREPQTFASAMGAVEKVFAEARTGFFSATASDFSFVEDAAVYTDQEEAHQAALREAMQHAAAKAAVIAEEGGLGVDSVMAVTEVVQAPKRRYATYESYDDDLMDFNAYSAPGYDLAAPSSPEFLKIAPRYTTGLVQLRVRFAATKIPRQPVQ